MIYQSYRSLLRALRKCVVGVFTSLFFICCVGISVVVGDDVVAETSHQAEASMSAHSEHPGHTHGSHEHTQQDGSHEDDSDEHGHHHHHTPSSLDVPLIAYPAVEDKFFSQVTVDYSKSSNVKCPVGPSYEIIKPPQVS